MSQEQTVRCEVSHVDHAGCMETMFVQVPVSQAKMNSPVFFGEEAWIITAIDSGNEANLYEEILA